MFSKIPGNTELRINLEGLVVDSFGRKVDLPKDEQNRCQVEIFGKLELLDLRTLGLLSLFNIEHLLLLGVPINNFSFYTVKTKLLTITAETIMLFNEPIYYKEGFRFIPNYHRFAINREGVVVDTFTNEVMPIYEESTYKLVSVKCSTNGYTRNVPLHRLIALAWIPNCNPSERPYINHINLDKRDNRIENLEWCSHLENTRHALRLRLERQGSRLKSRDILTGKIQHYLSLHDLYKALDMPLSRSVLSKRRPGHLFKGRYEVKVEDDDTPWFYEDVLLDKPLEGGKKVIYKITVTDTRTGSCRNYPTLTELAKGIGRESKINSVKDIPGIIEKEYPHLEVTISENALKGPYTVKDLVEGKIIILNSLSQIQEVTGVNRNMIRADILDNNKFIYDNRWIIVKGLSDPDPTMYKLKRAQNIPFILRNRKTGETHEFNSIKEGSRKLNIPEGTIRRRLNVNAVVKDWEYRSLD